MSTKRGLRPKILSTGQGALNSRCPFSWVQFKSFEWLILKSGLIHEKELEAILELPENFIDSREYMSWERFFTKLLTDSSSGTYLQYSKSKLNEVYLHDKNRAKILHQIRMIRFNRQTQSLP